jgi:hypothetical protein
MVRWIVVPLLLVASVAVAVPVGAQPGPNFRGPVFRVEPETRSDRTRTGFISGWIYNDGQGVAGLVKMRCEIVDGSGQTVNQYTGWAYGNVPPGGRAYFMIPIPRDTPPERRVVVDSWVLQSFSESP